MDSAGPTMRKHFTDCFTVPYTMFRTLTRVCLIRLTIYELRLTTYFAAYSRFTIYENQNLFYTHPGRHEEKKGVACLCDWAIQRSSDSI